MKKTLLILLVVMIMVMCGEAYALLNWNAAADFNPGPGPQSETAVWTYRQSGQWNPPQLPEGALLPYDESAVDDLGFPPGYPGYDGDNGTGNNGGSALFQPDDGFGGTAADEFWSWVPWVRWLSPISAPIQVTGRVRQNYADQRPHIYSILKNDVVIVSGSLPLNNVNAIFDETFNVNIGDRVDFKVVTDPAFGQPPYYVQFALNIAEVIPEPATLCLFGLGSAVLWHRRSRHTQI